MPLELVISADNDGRRVDRVLRLMWPDVPLGAIMRALRTGEVRLDGRRTKGDVRLAEGQRLTVPWEDGAKEKTEQKRQHETGKRLSTLYKDDFAWIVDKQAGLLTQPDVRGGDSLITRALAELRWSRSDYRPATVQRLDRNTSGAVIIALSGRAQRILAEMVRERRIKKIYRAVVEGLIGESGSIELPLLKDTRTNISRPDANGKPALTLYRRIAFAGGNSVVETELVTGRPHQARAHLAAIGHPITGDVKYGGSGAKRPLLHARLLIFPDDKDLPAGLRGAVIESPVPDDIQEYERGDL